MIVELISVGTELLLGNILNTNAKYLAEQCALLGYSMYHQTVVGDNEKRLAEVMRTALNRADVIITTGGLGPTKDDLTKEVAASVLGRKLINDEQTAKLIKTFFYRRAGVTEESQEIAVHIPENNFKQAFIIENSKVLENNNGTAPGLLIENENNTIVLLPGPPNEMIPLFENKVIPYLESKNDEIIYSIMVKLCGIGESEVAQVIDDLIEKQTNPTIAPYAKTSEVHLRITAKSKNIENAKRLIEPLLKEVQKRFGKYIFTIKEQESLEEVAVKLLKQYNLKIATAESCTGGLLAGRIVNVAGSSSVFQEGYITYSNEAKEKILHVKSDTLNQFGAVSEETATQMAVGCAKNAGADIGIATTGIAGPDGGTVEKPVGLVYIACYYKGKTIVEKQLFNGDREKVRMSTVTKAIDLLRRTILEES